MAHPIVRYATTIAPLLLFLGCAPQEDAHGPLVIDTMASPAGPGSGEPNLASAPDGRIYLSWLEPVDDSTHALRFSTLVGSRWSPPRTITQRPDFFVNWADFPSVIALSEQRLAAHWLQKSGTTKYAYEVRIAQSADGGRTWSTPVVPHRDGTPTEHGFVSMFALGDSLGAVWLDGRNFARVAKGESADMMLMMTSVAPTGGTGPERVLDERVCDCCQTSLGVAASGPVLVYRDRLHGEIRDISVVRWVDSAGPNQQSFTRTAGRSTRVPSTVRRLPPWESRLRSRGSRTPATALACTWLARRTAGVRSTHQCASTTASPWVASMSSSTTKEPLW
jgi:hypothetical protein